MTLGILTYCNAGSLLALFLEGGNVRVLESSGMPLGLFTHTTFEAMILALQEGDTLLVVTKGVTESRRGGSRVWRGASGAVAEKFDRGFGIRNL